MAPADQPTTAPRRARIPSLDGLRALSILVVLGAHAQRVLDDGPLKSALAATCGDGYWGVQVFFVISGYLITRLLLDEHAQNGRIDLIAFYRRRVRRIFPAFYTYLAVVAALALAGAIALEPRHLLATCLFLTNYDLGGHNWFIGHTWSLSMEEQFYLLWPALLIAAGVRRGRALALTVALAMPVMRVLTIKFLPDMREGLLGMLHTAADSLMYGCLAALCEELPAVARWRSRLARWGGDWAALLFLVGVAPLLGRWLGGAYNQSIGVSLNAIAAAVLLAIVSTHPHSALGRFLNWRPLVHLGVISYSLYLYQQLVMTPLNRTWTGQLPVSLLCALAMAETSYWLVERPFLRYRRTHAAPPPPAPSPPR